jgi:DNA-binding response OmpR family regulator
MNARVLVADDDPTVAALGEEGDRVIGLETGAGDRVTKPFSPKELALRVAAVLRGSRSSGGSAVGTAFPLCAGGLGVDAVARRALRDGRDLPLTGASSACSSI